MKYEIDGVTADGICRDVLGDTIKYMKISIKAIKDEIKIRGDKTPAVWLEDLRHNQEYLEAMKVVYRFFGGHLK